MNEFWAAIGGAIVGGLITGLITIVMQLLAIHEGRKLRDKDRKHIQKALGISLLIKLIRINGSFRNVRRYIESHFEEAKKRGLRGEPWQIVKPLVNPSAPVHFSSDELGLLMSLRSYDLFNLIAAMDESHNSLSDIIRRLNQQREDLAARLKPYHVHENVVSVAIDPDELLLLRPLMDDVNGLVEAVNIWAKDEYKKSELAITGLHNILQDRFDFVHKIKFKVDEPLKAAQSAGLNASNDER